MASKQYYLVSGERETGPFSLAELRTAQREGRATATSLVRAENEAETRPLSSVLRRLPRGEPASKATKQRRQPEGDGADEASVTPAESFSLPRPNAEQRDLAVTMLKKGSRPVDVVDALVAKSMDPEGARALVDELLRLRQPTESVTLETHEEPFKSKLTPRQWFFTAAVLVLLNVIINGSLALTETKGGPEQLGGVLGAALFSFLLPFLYVVIWKRRVTQAAKVRTFALFSLVMLSLRIVQLLVEAAMHS